MMDYVGELFLEFSVWIEGEFVVAFGVAKPFAKA